MANPLDVDNPLIMVINGGKGEDEESLVACRIFWVEVRGLGSRADGGRGPCT
jgi:hypothetical protein